MHAHTLYTSKFKIDSVCKITIYTIKYLSIQNSSLEFLWSARLVKWMLFVMIVMMFSFWII
jgi:hypothetical protein